MNIHFSIETHGFANSPILTKHPSKLQMINFVCQASAGVIQSPGRLYAISFTEARAHEGRQVQHWQTEATTWRRRDVEELPRGHERKELAQIMVTI